MPDPSKTAWAGVLGVKSNVKPALSEPDFTSSWGVAIRLAKNASRFNPSAYDAPRRSRARGVTLTWPKTPSPYWALLNTPKRLNSDPPAQPPALKDECRAIRGSGRLGVAPQRASLGGGGEVTQR